jgi:hypothetical protein
LGSGSGDKILKQNKKQITGTYFSIKNTPKSLKIKETKSAIYKRLYLVVISGVKCKFILILEKKSCRIRNKIRIRIRNNLKCRIEIRKKSLRIHNIALMLLVSGFKVR